MTVASFVPKFWAPSLEVPYQQALVYAQPGIADTKFQPILQNSGDTVSINAIGAAKIKDHNRTEDLVYDEIGTTELKLVMDKEKYYGFLVSDVDAKQATGDFQGAATEEHGRGMADVVDKDIAAELKAGAGTKLGSKPVFDGSDFYRPADEQLTAWDIVRKLALELNKVSAPTAARWVVVGPNFGSALIADRRVTQADAAGTDVVARSGLISAIPQLGLNIYQSTNVPVTGGREIIIAGVPGALAFASQLRTLEAFRNPDRFGDVIRGLQVYGSKVIRPSGIVSIEADVKPGVIGGTVAGGVGA
ncbi:phage major capsid protein [Corynebacterium flavescens]|uniref:Major capsid protein n=1 Tax=Corynebacterium flavescens TaxID=28028 RepID=A0A1L7CNJ7_CORFL|nr:hypothetical protein [Corynebacterium flavescens]APT87385.1 hypothetical protein CFLV_09445 [Corynebacterium flavescens]KAA8720468.1 hypothetical protein F4V60_09205 [Corynebacterium flavescens]GEB97771.1 hypothetical protein CFL01nite_12660 [Corynebacterium flavescens]